MDNLTTLLSADPDRYWEVRNTIEREGSAIAAEFFGRALETLYDHYGEENGRAAFRLLARGYLDLLATEPDPDEYRKERIPYRLRREVLERDAYRCQQCGDWHHLAVDHIIPESKGGPMTLDNLQCLCRTCNTRKGNRV